MSLFESMFETYAFNRQRTLATLDRIEKMDHSDVLLWRPGPQRAHVAWQLMHIGITEDIFASERLAPSKSGLHTELWERFRGGSTPDEQPVTVNQIREILDSSRKSLMETLGQFDESDLETIPAALVERGLTIRAVLHIISWHESHHQGQVQLTLNLFEQQA